MLPSDPKASGIKEGVVISATQSLNGTLKGTYHAHFQMNSGYSNEPAWDIEREAKSKMAFQSRFLN